MDQTTTPMTCRPSGFSLIELLVVVMALAILAAIVIPQISNAATLARETSLRDNLRLLRTQISLYRAEHDDVAPGYPDGNTSATPTQEAFLAQMTQYSNRRGQTSPTPAPGYDYGPYFSTAPRNPFTDQTSVLVLADGAAIPTAPTGTYGWIYHPKTATLLCNNEGSDLGGDPYFGY